jgi:curved DNA-binding protein CbpA
MTLYEILEITLDATDAEITKAWRRLSMRFHSDRNPGDPDAAAQYQRVQDAHAVLIDPERRREYDETGHCSNRAADRQQELMAVLVQELLVVMRNRGLFSAGVTQRDLVHEMRDSLHRKQAEVEQLLERMNTDEREFKEVLKRIVVADGDVNVFEEPLKAQLAGIAKHRAQGKADLDKLQRCLDYLKKCKYKIGGPYTPDPFERALIEGVRRRSRPENPKKVLGIPAPNPPSVDDTLDLDD